MLSFVFVVVAASLFLINGKEIPRKNCWDGEYYSRKFSEAAKSCGGSAPYTDIPEGKEICMYAAFGWSDESGMVRDYKAFFDNYKKLYLKEFQPEVEKSVKTCWDGETAVEYADISKCITDENNKRCVAFQAVTTPAP